MHENQQKQNERNLTHFDDWQLENKISRPLARTRIQSTLCHKVTVAMVTGRQGSDAQCYLQQHRILTKRWLHCQLLECDDRSTSLNNPSPGPFRYTQSTDLQLRDLWERSYKFEQLVKKYLHKLSNKRTKNSPILLLDCLETVQRTCRLIPCYWN